VGHPVLMEQKKEPQRIISLLPSATEIVCALGAAERLVGISHECDFPQEIKDLPALTRSRIRVDRSSKEIDEAVREAITRGAVSIYSIDEERLAQLSPDLIVTQDLCEVCAVSFDDVCSAVARLAHKERVQIISLRPTLLVDVLDDIERVAIALHQRERGKEVRASLESRIEAIKDRALRATTRPRVVSLEWLEPIMLGGTWMPELISLAGGEPVGVSVGGAAPTITPEALRGLEPEVVMIKPCGFTIERTFEERAMIERAIVPVVGASSRIYITDGNAFFNRPGPRLVESLEILAACLHPELFDDFVQKHAAVIVPLHRGH
jgi:iron complex transport system substrate-binding protein